MSEEDKAKLLAKHEALGPLLNRLAHCQNALNIAGAGWKWDNPLGAYSLSLTKTGGLDMLNVYRQPCYIAGGKSLSLMQKAKCLKDMEGAYPSLPPKSVRTAVSAFNKAVFSIRMLLAAEGKPLWKAVGEAVKWFGDNGKELKLSVKLNGTELNVDPLKAFVKVKMAEAKGAVVDAGNVMLEDAKAAVQADIDTAKDATMDGDEAPEMSKSDAMKSMKKGLQLPSFDFNIESLMPKAVSDITNGKVDLTFELTGPGASALDTAPKEMKAVLDALVGSDNSVLAAVSSKLKKFALMLKENDDYDEEDVDEKAMKGVTKKCGEGEERLLSYTAEETAAYNAVYKNGGKDVGGDFVRFGFGGATKYTQSIIKILEELPDRLKEATTLIENIVKDPGTYLDITDPTKTKCPNFHALDLPRIPITFMQYSNLVTTLPTAIKRAVQSIMQALVYAILAFRDPVTYALAPLDADDKVAIAVPEDTGAAEAASVPAAKGKKEPNKKEKAPKKGKETATKASGGAVAVPAGSYKISLCCPCNADGCGLCCCLKVCCAGPCVWGSMMATGGETIGAGGCKKECCFPCCCCVHTKRAAIGKAYGIKGGCCDCCKDYLCTCCSMVQLMNEVKVREDGAWSVCGPKKGGGGPHSQEMERSSVTA